MISERNHHRGCGISVFGRGSNAAISLGGGVGVDSSSSSQGLELSRSSSAWNDLDLTSSVIDSNNISSNNDNRLYSRNDLIQGAKEVLGSDDDAVVALTKTQQSSDNNSGAIYGDGGSGIGGTRHFEFERNRIIINNNCPNDMQLSSGLGNGGHLNNNNKSSNNTMAQKGDKNGWGNIPHSPNSTNNNNGGGGFKDFSEISSQFSSSSFNAQGPSNNGGSGANNMMDNNSRSGGKPVLGNNKDNYSSSGWGGSANSTSGGGSSGSKSWNIPNGAPSSNQQSSASMKYGGVLGGLGESGDSSYEGLIGATGGSDTPPNAENNHDAKMNSMRNLASSSSGWGVMPPPRMGLLGGGETSLNNNNGSWGAPPPPSSATSGWNGSNSANNNQWGSGRQNSGSSVDQSNSNQGLSSPKHNTWAQAAGKGLTGTGPQSHMGSVSNGNVGGSQIEPITTPSSKNKQDDHVSEIKIAAAYSDGWGQLNVNQDSGWDVPPSPQASPKENNSSMWRAPANTGTEIWENNIRQRTKGGASGNPGSGNSGSGAAQPWGHHTPTTHIGGTWGEEEDTSNMWTGVPQGVNNQASNNNSGPNNGGNNNGWGSGGDPTPNPNMWGNGGREDNRGGGGGGGGDRYNSGNDSNNKHWGNPSTTASSWCEPDCNTGPDPGTSVWGAPPNKSNNNNNMNANPNHGGWGQSNMNNNPQMGGGGGGMNMGGGNIGGNMGGGGMNGGGNPGNVNKGNPKDGPPSGWEEPSPPMPRRPVTNNFDDGTSLWGNPNRQVKVSHWKEMPTNKPNQMGGNGMPGNGPPGNANMNQVGMAPGGGGGNSMGDGNQSAPPTGPGMIRLPSNAGGPNKMEMGPWNKTPRTLCGPGTWTDLPPHRDSPGPGKWDDPHTPNQLKGVPGTPTTPGSWGEPGSPLPPYWGAKPKNPATSWSDGQIDTSTWSGPAKQGGKPLSKELIWASKQFRLLTEIGYKKDDVENALRMTNMNIDEALGELEASCEREVSCGILDMEGRSNKVRGVNCADEMVDRMHPNFVGGYHNSGCDVPSGPAGFQGPQVMAAGFNSMQGYKTQLKSSGLNSNTPSLLSNPAMSGQGSSLNLSNSINNLTPAMIQKIVQHQQQQQQQQQQQSAQNIAQSFNATQSLNPNSLGNQPGRINQQNFPTAAQLRHLVQQIQMAVQAGHLNPQILNQPLAPQTLMLLYQLLQQIKALHQLQQQQVYQTQHLSKGGGGGSGPGAGGPGNPSPLQLVNVQITQTKQRIVNYQNQIAAQQALFLKQQVVEPINNHLPHQGGQHLSGLHSGQPSSADLFKPALEPMQGLHNDFRDMTIKDPSPSVPTSRLSQWKMSSMEKDNIAPPGANNPNSMGSNVPPGHGGNSVSSGGSNAGPANSNDFSRAPGSISKSGNASSGISSSSSHSNQNSLHPLLTQGDSAWSSLPQSQGDAGGWPDSSNQQGGNPGGNPSERQSTNNGNGGNNGNNPGNSGNSNSGNNGNNMNSAGGNYNSSDAKDNTSAGNNGNGSGNQGQSAYNISDLVPEFEPGKPWKGNSQMKNVEDDPHITPGSITQSPFSLNTIKEPDLFNWSAVTSKSSPVSTTNSGGDSIVSSLTASLTSSTWAFTPPTTSLQSQTSTGSKQTNSKSNWSAVNESSDLWGGNVSKTRGPPPGLSGQGKNMGDPWNSGSHTPGAGARHSWGSSDNRSSGVSPGWDRQNNSNFLVLRNLTPQIDGSTLKTLCVQHGPLQLFHLFLNQGHGIALVRYSSREEASKAQLALNNCVLGNTTIMVDVPTESEVAQYLQVANGGGPNGGGGGGQGGASGLSTNQGVVTSPVTGSGWPNSQSQSTSSASAVVGNQAVTPGFRGGNASNASYQFGGGNQGNTPVGAGKMVDNKQPVWNSSRQAPLQSNHLWSYPGSANSLWGTSGASLLEHHDQGSPSSLNSFLPEDLLGGESN